MRQEQLRGLSKWRELAAEEALELVGFHARRDIAYILSTSTLFAGTIKACRNAKDTEALYKKFGKWREPDGYSPRIGDFVVHYGAFDNAELKGHGINCGFVYSDDGKKLTVIGLDHRGMINFYNLDKDNQRIKGYCCPSYGQ